jgi:hypothetical protein
VNQNNKLNVEKELIQHPFESGDNLTKKQKKMAYRRQAVFLLLVRGIITAMK